ncbi:esterase/thioesterase [Gammaproteobacteria bacterium]
MVMTHSFSWSVRVYYEDTDAAGVVYYANYLKFLERARTEWLRALGFEQDVLRRELGVIFVVRTVTVDYLRPARFNDLLEVVCRLEELNRVSLVFSQEVRYSGADDQPLCTGKVKVACLDATTLRPRPLPANLVTEIRGVE